MQADKQKADAAEAARRTQEEQQLQRLQAEEDAAQQQRSYEREISDKLTGLPQEPSPDDNDAVSVMIRLPNGLRFSRRYCPQPGFCEIRYLAQSGRNRGEILRDS